MGQIPLDERYVDLGVKAIDQQDLMRAVRYLNRALSLNPSSYLAYYNRGVSFDLQDRLQEALSDYDRALAIQPNHLASLHNRAVILREMGRPEEATAEIGQKILQAVTAEVTEFLQDFAQWPQLPKPVSALTRKETR